MAGTTKLVFHSFADRLSPAFDLGQDHTAQRLAMRLATLPRVPGTIDDWQIFRAHDLPPLPASEVPDLVPETASGAKAPDLIVWCRDRLL
ncbi:hypothetical protein [Mesorhizobium amorphae]|uniref:hypothetical protein n=1 Tax=Mesorhizobium amorphae TaxID=71433 RepID=UPI0021B2B151|nr:hypothetical protein [Mesorhizobium amorphae]